MTEGGVRVVLGRGEPLASIPRDEKIALLRRHGGVLFRGFHVDTDGFLAVARELGRDFYNMALDPRIREMVTPDGVVAGVLKGTSALPLHMERGYSPLKPELVLFHVLRPSPAGGESLLCSGARVLEALSPRAVARFRATRAWPTRAWPTRAWSTRAWPTRACEVSGGAEQQRSTAAIARALALIRSGRDDRRGRVRGGGGAPADRAR